MTKKQQHEIRTFFETIRRDSQGLPLDQLKIKILDNCQARWYTQIAKPAGMLDEYIWELEKLQDYMAQNDLHDEYTEKDKQEIKESADQIAKGYFITQEELAEKIKKT